MNQDGERKIFASRGTSVWTTVYERWYEEDLRNEGIYSALAAPSLREKALSDPGWDLTKGDFAPGFSQHHDENAGMGHDV